jgi:hypothetical protein
MAYTHFYRIMILASIILVYKSKSNEIPCRFHLVVRANTADEQAIFEARETAIRFLKAEVEELKKVNEQLQELVQSTIQQYQAKHTALARD